MAVPQPDKNQSPTGTEQKPVTDVNTTTPYSSGTSGTQIQSQVATEQKKPATEVVAAERPKQRDTALEEANRQKMLASKQLTGTEDATLAQEKVNLFTYGTEAPIFGAVDSSKSAATEMDAAGGGAIEDLAATQKQLLDIKQPEYKEYTDYTEEIAGKQTQYKDTFERVKATIEEDYRLRKIEQESENRVQTGASTKALARMGALGRGGSALSYLHSVTQNNQEKINKLLNEKEKLLIGATEAYQRQDWTVMQAKIAESHKITDQYNQIQTWNYEDSLKTNDQIMEQARFGWDAEGRAMKKISDIANSETPFEDIPKSDIYTLAAQANLSVDTVKALYETTRVKAKESHDKAIFDMRKDIPPGQTVQIGDKFYSSLQSKFGGKLPLIVTDGKSNKQYLLVEDESAPNGIKRIDLGIKGKGNPSKYTEKQLTAMGNEIATAFPDGAIGGDCGEFLHKLMPTWNYGLNTVEEKMSQIDDSIGLGPDQDQPQVGDVVIQSALGGPYEANGHVSMINSYDPTTGIMTLTESNYSGPKEISNTRTLNAADTSVLGFYRNDLNPQFMQKLKEPEVKLTQEEKDFENDIRKQLDEFAGGGGDWGTAYDRIYARYKPLLEQIGQEIGIDSHLVLDNALRASQFRPQE